MYMYLTKYIFIMNFTGVCCCCCVCQKSETLICCTGDCALFCSSILDPVSIIISLWKCVKKGIKFISFSYFFFCHPMNVEVGFSGRIANVSNVQGNFEEWYKMWICTTGRTQTLDDLDLEKWHFQSGKTAWCQNVICKSK